MTWCTGAADAGVTDVTTYVAQVSGTAELRSWLGYGFQSAHRALNSANGQLTLPTWLTLCCSSMNVSDTRTGISQCGCGSRVQGHGGRLLSSTKGNQLFASLGEFQRCSDDTASHMVP